MAGKSGMELPLPVVWHPQNAAEARRFKLSLSGTSFYISGGTLLRTQWESGIRQMPDHLISLSGIRELQGVVDHGSAMVLGSQTTLADCRCSLLLKRTFPLLVDAARAIAAPSVRNLATLGGNVLSTVGDSLPALLAYDGELTWLDEGGEHIEPVERWLGRLAQGAAADMDRLLVSIRLPLGSVEGGSERSFAFYDKVGRREAFTPSLVTLALRGTLDSAGRLRRLRLAAGGGQTIPRRFPELEKHLEGAHADESKLAEAYEMMMNDFEPKGDAFASEDYRRVMAAGLVTARLWQVLQGKDAGRGR